MNHTTHKRHLPGLGFSSKPLCLGILSGLALLSFVPSSAHAALNIPITVNLSEAVNVTGTPRIAVDVGGTSRYATYTSGTGTNALTFTLSPQAGDVDLDGVSVSSPIQLNGGTIKDAKGNNAALTFTPPITTNVKVNYPSLSLDFTYDADGRYTVNGTAYNDLTSFLTATGGTFSRSGTATYFDSAGVMQTAASNTPRFDYDPVTHAAKGILIEEARTNLLKYSDQFDNAYWGKANSTISANEESAPTGIIDVDRLVESASSGKHEIYFSSIPVTAGAYYSFSIYVKAKERNQISLEFQTAYFGANITRYNLLSESVMSGSGSITYVGNGFYRCQKSVIATASGNATAYIGLWNGTTNNYTGDGSSGVYIWGAQLEQGTFSTSYIPTTTAAVARGADNFTIPTTAGWFSAATGTFMGQFEEASALNTGGDITHFWDIAFRTLCLSPKRLHNIQYL